MCRYDLEQMRREWNGGMTGVVPNEPGYYWLFVQRWRITEVRMEGTELVVSWPPDKPVRVIHWQRWGREF